MMQKDKKQPELVQGNSKTANNRFGELDYFFEQSFDLMCIAGLDGRFQRVNPAFERILGWTAEELESESYMEYVHPDDKAAIRIELEKLNEGKAAVGYEHRFRCQDGSYKWLAWNAHPTPKGLVYAVARDVTDYRQTEENLRALTEEMHETTIAKQAVELQNVAEISTAVASHTDPAGILQTAVDLTKDSFNFYQVHIYLLNEAGDELNMVAGSGKIGRQIVSEGHHIPLDQEQSLIARTARTRREVIVNDVAADSGFLPHPLLPHTRSEMAIPMIVGQQMLGVLDVQAEEPDRFIDTDSQIISTLAAQIATTLQNIRRYEQIQESEEKYRSILESMEDGYYETTLEGNFLFFNEALCRVYGYSADELMGMNYRQMMVEEDDERVFKTFNNVYKTGEPVQSFEYKHIRRDGSQRVISLSISRIEDARGKPAGFRGLGRDVTERRQAQAELEFQRALLETQSEASPDGILLVANDREILSYNQRFVEMWSIPQEVIEQRDSQAADQHLLEGVVDPVSFATTTEYLYEHPDESSQDEIALKDGRFLERFSSPIANADGTHYGRVWYFHDITEQKQAEQMTQEFLERMKALNEASVELAQVETLGELYKEAIKLAITRLGFDRIGFYMRNDDENPYLLTATFGTDVDGTIRDEHSFTLDLSDTPRYMDMIANKERLLVTEDADLWDVGQIVGHGWHLVAPVWDDEEFLGIFFVDNLHKQRPLKPYEPELLTLYSTAIASLFVRKRTEETLAKQAVELEAVAQVSTAVSQTLNPIELLQNVADLTKARFNLYHAHIYLLGKRRQTLHLTAGAGEVGRQMVSEGRHIALYAEQSLIARAAREQQGIISNDVRADASFLPHPLLPDTQAEMAVPIMSADEVVGVLDIQSEKVGYFTEDDIRIQTTLATQVAVALQNSRLFAESEEARAELSLLTRRLTREGWQDYMATQASDVMFHYGISETEPDIQINTAVAKMEKTLVVQGEPIGRLAVDEPGILTNDAADIMAAVAERLSTHIENLRLTEQTQLALFDTEEQAQRLALLNEMSAALNAVNTVEEVYQIATEQTAKILGVDRVSLPLLTKDRANMVIVAFHGDEYEAPTGAITPLAGPMATALQENRLVVNNNPTGDLKTVMVAPLYVAGRSIGTMNIGSKTANAFAPRDENLLLQIASLLAARIENLRLLTEAQARAERERQVRTITDKIRRATDREQILQVARQELGEMLGAKETAVQLGTQQQLLETLKREKSEEN